MRRPGPAQYPDVRRLGQGRTAHCAAIPAIAILAGGGRTASVHRNRRRYKHSNRPAFLGTTRLAPDPHQPQRSGSSRPEPRHRPAFGRFGRHRTPQPRLRRQLKPYSGCRESIVSVTGPSLTTATCISAPNTPVGTGLPSSADNLATKRSNSGCDTSPRAARLQDGRLPFFTEAYKVNCETARISPPTSSTLRFITPFSSAMMRMRTILPAIQSRSASPSVSSKPASTSKPRPICPLTRPSTVTDASLTRCTTTRIVHSSQIEKAPNSEPFTG